MDNIWALIVIPLIVTLLGATIYDYMKPRFLNWQARRSADLLKQRISTLKVTLREAQQLRDNPSAAMGVFFPRLYSMLMYGILGAVSFATSLIMALSTTATMSLASLFTHGFPDDASAASFALSLLGVILGWLATIHSRGFHLLAWALRHPESYDKNSLDEINDLEAKLAEYDKAE